MGVVTVTDIDYGQIFGPFPSHVTPADPAYLIGMLTNDKRPDGIVLKMDPGERREGLRAVDWLPYIQPARDPEEQNMEAYVKAGQVYYRTLRIVRTGEELLVWYSKDFAQLLHIPELPRNSVSDGEQFICPRCGDTFDYPYPLRAHIKFKCSYTLSELNSNRPGMPDRKNGQHDTGRNALKLPTDAAKIRSSTDTRPSGTPSPRDRSPGGQLGGFGDRGRGSPPAGVKRCHGDGSGQALSPKIPRISEPKTERLDSRSVLSSEIRRNASEFRGNGSEIRRDDQNSLLTPGDKSPRKSPCDLGAKDEHGDVGSAFRKVERSLSPDGERSGSETSSRAGDDKLTLSPVGGAVSMSLPTSLPPSGPAPPISSMSTLPGPPTSMAGMPASLMGLYMPRLPMVPPGLGLTGGPAAAHIHPVSAHHPAFAAADQIPPGLLEMCRAAIPSVGPLTESFANIRNGDTTHGPGFPLKPSMFLAGGDRNSGPGGPTPFIKTNNPMVEKILQSTSPALMSSPLSAINVSQNWCAKCNATFRMTSDLVYHMRSHHKREFDPMKRKREEKLKCNICNETFRERHHLTRHMSSHA